MRVSTPCCGNRRCVLSLVVKRCKDARGRFLVRMINSLAKTLKGRAIWQPRQADAVEGGSDVPAIQRCRNSSLIRSKPRNFTPSVRATLQRPRWDERCRYLPIKGADDSRRYVRRGGPGPLSESTLRRRRRRKGTAVIHPKKQGPRMLAVIKAACRAPVIQTACCFVFPLWLPVYIFMPASVEEDCVLISSERERKGKKIKSSSWTFWVALA